MAGTEHQRVELVEVGAAPGPDAFGEAVREGLTSTPKRLACQYFYDQAGSRLFEEICELDEYYLTRAERQILESHAPEIVSSLPHRVDLLELGSGSGAKTRLIIEALLARQGSLHYLPIDISRSAIEDSATDLVTDYPALSITGLIGEYTDGLERLADNSRPPRLVLWLGSSIGNLHRGEAATLLEQVLDCLSPDDQLLIGFDRRKDPGVLERAYDDASGVTARFNKNILARINRELGGEFDPERFRHRAVYEVEIGRIEMYLISEAAQRVRIEALGLEVPFEPGEQIHTENSYKYSGEEIEALARDIDRGIAGEWMDPGSRFSLCLFAGHS